MAPLLEHLCQTILSALPVLSYFSTPSLPSLSLTLTPKFNQTQSVTSLLGVLVIDGTPKTKAGEVLLEMNMLWPNVPSNNYSGSRALQVSDENGPLPIFFRDENDTRYWYSENDAQGKLTAVFEAFARQINGHEPLGPRIDLREDQGGMIGAGVTFIPVPPNKSTIFEIELNWDLTGAPEGTSAAWSLGDVLHMKKTGTTDILSLSNYIVGPINRYTSKIPRDNGLVQDFGMYWFGSPQSFDVQKLAEETKELFIGMAPFFEDTEDSYRVFIRFNQKRGFGGTGLYRSFVMEYDPWEEFDDLYLTFLLAHEMVHNWALMEMGDKREDEEGGFYVEGMFHFSSTYLSMHDWKEGLLACFLVQTRLSQQSGLGKPWKGITFRLYPWEHQFAHVLALQLSTLSVVLLDSRDKPFQSSLSPSEHSPRCKILAILQGDQEPPPILHQTSHRANVRPAA
jgi:hypothetical protein